MDFSAIKDLYIGSTPVQSAWLNGSKVWGRKPAVDEQSIRDAMILWYDLKKQGATNESMAENPVLRDLSVNGHDATCYNFAWSGMSGIGGYYFTELHGITANQCTYELTGDKSKITILTAKGDSSIFTFINSIAIGDAYHYKVKVTGFDVFKQSFPNAFIQDAQAKRITADGVYDFYGAATYEYVALTLVVGQDIAEGTAINITIEQLPLYHNALVSDGVDDYCLVEGLPLLNKEDGYTVIAKRKWIGNKGCLSHKRDTVDENGAFQFERYYAQGDARFTNFSFGEKTSCPIQIDDITYQTTASYNGNVLNVGDLLDNKFLQLFHYGYNVNDGLFSSIALHSFILFNRDLTTEEIEWVKTNLIESEQ